MVGKTAGVSAETKVAVQTELVVMHVKKKKPVSIMNVLDEAVKIIQCNEISFLMYMSAEHSS